MEVIRSGVPDTLVTPLPVSVKVTVSPEAEIVNPPAPTKFIVSAEGEAFPAVVWTISESTPPPPPPVFLKPAWLITHHLYLVSSFFLRSR